MSSPSGVLDLCCRAGIETSRSGSVLADLRFPGFELAQPDSSSASWVSWSHIPYTLFVFKVRAVSVHEQKNPNSGETRKHILANCSKWSEAWAVNTNQWSWDGKFNRCRGRCNNLTQTLASSLASSGGNCLAFWDWNFISAKTMCKMGHVYEAEGEIGNLKPCVAKSPEFTRMWFVASVENTGTSLQS